MKAGTQVTLRVLCLTGLVLAGLCAVANALPTTVYVYNHNPGDAFDDNAEGYIWQQLGLLNANGQPINPIPEAQIIRDANNNIIGYRSADGTREAYNVNSSATTAQAWQRVAVNGELHIVKHGCTYKGDDGTQHRGGGMLLDGGQPYDGFGTGTGVGYLRSDGTSGAYPLPARPGANITLNANGCHTSNDPDGNGNQSSVTGSAGGVNGVGQTQGHNGRVYAICNYTLTGGTAAQRAAALAAMRAAARAAGFPPRPANGAARGPTTDNDIGAWICSLPFSTRYATVQQVINQAVPPAGTVNLNLTYSKSETAPGGGGQGGFHVCPVQLPVTLDTIVTYTYCDDFDALTVLVEEGDLATPALFLIDTLGELPAPAPEGLELGSAVFHLDTINGYPIQAPVDILFGFYATSADVEVLWYDPELETWAAPLGTVTIDPAGGVVIVSTEEMGTYAVFAPTTVIPTVSEWGLVVMALLLLTAGTVVCRRRWQARRVAA